VSQPNGPKKHCAVSDAVERFKGPRVADSQVFNTSQGLSGDGFEHHSTDLGRRTNPIQDRSPSRL